LLYIIGHFTKMFDQLIKKLQSTTKDVVEDKAVKVSVLLRD